MTLYDLHGYMACMTLFFYIYVYLFIYIIINHLCFFLLSSFFLFFFLLFYRFLIYLFFIQLFNLINLMFLQGNLPMEKKGLTSEFIFFKKEI